MKSVKGKCIKNWQRAHNKATGCFWALALTFPPSRVWRGQNTCHSISEALFDQTKPRRLSTLSDLSLSTILSMKKETCPKMSWEFCPERCLSGHFRQSLLLKEMSNLPNERENSSKSLYWQAPVQSRKVPGQRKN